MLSLPRILVFIVLRFQNWPKTYTDPVPSCVMAGRVFGKPGRRGASAAGAGSMLGTTNGTRAEEKHAAPRPQRCADFGVSPQVSHSMASVHLRKGRWIHIKSFQAWPSPALLENTATSCDEKFSKPFCHSGTASRVSESEIIPVGKGLARPWWGVGTGEWSLALVPDTMTRSSTRAPARSSHGGDRSRTSVLHLPQLAPKNAAPSSFCSPFSHKFFHRSPLTQNQAGEGILENLVRRTVLSSLCHWLRPSFL